MSAPPAAGPTRRELLKLYRAAGGRVGLKKKTTRRRRTTRRRYTRRAPSRSKGMSVSFPGNVTMAGLGAYRAPNSAAFGEGAGNLVGSFLPGPYKALTPLLGKAGGWLGNKIGSWLGLGAYTLNRNSIVIDEGNSPLMMNGNDDTVIVRHREYVGEVYSSATAGAFTVSNFALQPGNSALFEWLAPIANQYQEWVPMGIVAEFKSNSGEVVSGPTNALGQVIMATDYNAYNTTPFQNKSQMNNTVYSTNAKITQSFVHAIECDPRKNVMESFFVRAGPVPAGQPPQLYDLGTFAIASHGCQGASQDLGELWFSYEIGLRKASLIQTYASAVPTDIFQSYGYAGRTGGTSSEYWRGSVPDAANSLGCSVSPSGDVLFFPRDLEQGRYLFQMRFYIDAPTLTHMPGNGPPSSAITFTTSNCTMLSYWTNIAPLTPQLLFGTQAFAGAEPAAMCVSFVVDLTGNNATLTAGNLNLLYFGGVPDPGGYTVTTIITQMNQNAAIPAF